MKMIRELTDDEILNTIRIIDPNEFVTYDDYKIKMARAVLDAAWIKQQETTDVKAS